MSFESTAAKRQNSQFLSRGQVTLSSSLRMPLCGLACARVIRQKVRRKFRLPLPIRLPHVASTPTCSSQHQRALRNEAVLNMRIVAQIRKPKSAVSETARASNTTSQCSFEWHTNVRTTGRFRYPRLSGVDLVYYGNPKAVEYDFVVAPAPIQRNRTRVRRGPDGSKENSSKRQPRWRSRSHVNGGNLSFHKPIVYQNQDSTKTPVEGRYLLKADGHVGFESGATITLSS